MKYFYKFYIIFSIRIIQNIKVKTDNNKEKAKAKVQPAAGIIGIELDVSVLDESSSSLEQLTNLLIHVCQLLPSNEVIPEEFQKKHYDKQERYAYGIVVALLAVVH